MPDLRALDVEVFYVAEWGHPFFGIVDAAVPQLQAGKTPLDAGGRFQIEVPDFSKDAVTNQVQDAYLDVRVINHSQWPQVTRVLPQPDLLYRNVGLKILPSYDSEVAFTWR